MQSNLPLIPLQLDVSTAIKLAKNEGMFKERTLMARNDAWHRIKILHGAKYDKEYVLKAILTAAEPADLIPVRYQSAGGDDTSFIARNCGPALEKLCKTNLIIKIPNNDPLILVITLAFASIQDLKVSIQPLLLASLTKRYDPTTKSLDLNNFHRQEEISKHVFCPLSQTRTFSHVLKLTKTALASFEHLNLQNNELVSLTALENSNLTEIRTLDLRNNNLMGMETLTPIRSLMIIELWLDGNPLCENYSSSRQYIESALKYCPHLVKLDGVSLDNENIPPINDNYFPDDKVKKLVKQFANHFFILHDQKDRLSLRVIYDKNAIYSLSFDVKPDTKNRKNFGPYMMENRNILNQSDFLNSDSLLYRGPNEIITAIKKLPNCIHDRTSFHYDVLYNNNKLIALEIRGVVKILTPALQVLSFNRTFILASYPENEYKIINDHYHINSIITGIVSSNFEKQLEDIDYDFVCFSPREKKQLAMTLGKITRLNDKWSWQFLEDVNWDLKKAILNFVNAYSTSVLPNDAFK
ncbi:hypothetical protein PV325_011512 [Microctonus aethiopoides]|nr:hypothetical protein PV325_011512 [Microctonus aethiopoides]